jgi:hypothetical protein
MRTAKVDLKLDQLWVVHPGEHGFPIDKGITAVPLVGIQEVAAKF